MAIQTLTQEQLANINKGVVKVYGNSCSPCKALAPVFEEVVNSRTDVDFYEVCLEEDTDFVKSLGVRSVPTLLFIKDGQIVSSVTGFKPSSLINETIDSVLQ